MKKLLALLLAGVMVLGLMACGGTTTEETTAAGEETTAEGDVTGATADANGLYCSDEFPVVNFGEFDATQIKEGLLVTSIGQSADNAMLEALLKKIVPDYTSNATATEADLTGIGTVIAVVGASTKGLGAAGISVEEELARAAKLLEACKTNGVTVIVAHIGGADRRGSTSDQFTEAALPYANYMMVVDGGNADDGLFTKFQAENNVPLTLAKSIASLKEPLETIFAK